MAASSVTNDNVNNVKKTLDESCMFDSIKDRVHIEEMVPLDNINPKGKSEYIMDNEDFLYNRYTNSLYGLKNLSEYNNISLIDEMTVTAMRNFIKILGNPKSLYASCKINGAPSSNSVNNSPFNRSIYEYGVTTNYDNTNVKNDETKITIEYNLSGSFHRISYDGNIIYYGTKIIKNGYETAMKIYVFTEENIDIIKDLIETVTNIWSNYQKQKNILDKKLTVFTNYRKGLGSGASHMMYANSPYMANQNKNSDWKPSQSIRARSLNSIFLQSDIKETLLNDISDFMSDKTKEWYNYHDIPSKRSYLFYGPPGTGKTSTVKGIASMYNMNLYIMKLNTGEMDDQMLTNLVEQLPRRCMLLIEDIDYSFGREGEKTMQTNGLTFSGLMNILDGVTSFNQQVIVLTTNNREMVNRESLRVGRIDMEIEFGYMDNNQTIEMLKSFYSDVSDDDISECAEKIMKHKNVTPAELQEVIIRFKNKDFEYFSDNVYDEMNVVKANRTESNVMMYN